MALIVTKSILISETHKTNEREEGEREGDPDGGPGAESTAELSPAHAVEPDVEAVAPFNRSDSTLKQIIREGKHAKPKTSRRQSKPSGASAHTWKYLPTYTFKCASSAMASICKLFREQHLQQLDQGGSKKQQIPNKPGDDAPEHQLPCGPLRGI